MVIPYRVGKRKRKKLAIGGATIAILLLYCVLYPASPDLTDVFYPPPTADQHPQLLNRNEPADFADSRTSSGEEIRPSPSQTGWISAAPLPALADDNTIFLLETSGRSDITPREWCAVESAARAHPRHTVLFLVAAARVKHSPLAAAVLALGNTRLARLRFADLFAGTVLQGWYKSRVVLSSWWPASHMSDAVRFALLDRFGGIYLDTDVVVTRSMAGEMSGSWGRDRV